MTARHWRMPWHVEQWRGALGWQWCFLSADEAQARRELDRFRHYQRARAFRLRNANTGAIHA